MPFSLVIGSIAVSYFANNIPTLRALWDKHKGIDVRIRNCFEAAKNHCFPNDSIKDHLPLRYSSFSSLGRYLSSNANPDEETIGFLNELERQFRGDELCSHLLLEWKLDEINSQLTEFIQNILFRQKSFNEISSNLSSAPRNLIGKYHIKRIETNSLLNWVSSNQSGDDPLDRIAVVTGEAGCGKTVVLADFVEALERESVPVIGLKADYLFDATETDIDKAVNIGGKTLLSVLNDSASLGLTVLVIDQVDALSLSLTSRRKPLAEVQRVIQTAATHPNMRIVFSCREYDFHNERCFDRYETATRFHVSGLTKETIIDALTALDVPVGRISEEEFDFLRNPLNLSLYCRFRDTLADDKRVSFNSLLGAFWKYVLVERPMETGIETSRLVEYLTILTNKMVAQQVLTISCSVMGTAWAKEQSFLISCGFLSLNTDESKLQFFHQTLYDYTIARLFIENNKSVDSSFVGIHQGLFIRGRLKRVLEYQRGVSEAEYIKSVRSVLGIDASKNAYRFHLKYLVVSLMGSYRNLLPGEIEIIKNYVLTDAELSKAYARSVIGKEPVLLLRKYIQDNGGYNNCSALFAEKIFYLLPYFYSKERDVFWMVLPDIMASNLSGQRKSSFLRVFDHLPVGTASDVEELLPVVKHLDTIPYELPFDLFYRSAAQYYPQAIVSRMRSYVKSFVEKWLREKEHIWDLDISFEASEVLRCFSSYHSRESLSLNLQLLDILLDASQEQGSDGIKSSFLYFMYNRSNESYRFPDKLLDSILDGVEKGVEESWNGIDGLLKELSLSNQAIKHVIAIVGWLKSPERYKSVAGNYLIDNLNKEEYSSVLKYYQIELFGAVFMLVNKDCQDALVETAMNVSPEWEKIVLKDRTSTEYSNTMIGKTKAQLLLTIPKTYLRENYPRACHKLQEIERKGFVLNNEAPNRMQMMSGWTTLSNEQFDKMRAEDYVKFAEKYDKNHSFDFSTPTLVGNAWAMRDRAKDKPEEFFEIYKTLLKNGKAELYYVSSALSTLQEGGLDEKKLIILYGLLINAIKKDVNKAKSEVVMDLCRSLEFYIKNEINAPEVLMDYVLNVARTADDSSDDEGGRHIDFNTGINRVRGCAVDHLIRSSFMESYRESIFTVLEQMAGSASVATRCAALFQMAFLMRYDKERTLNLFLSMTADYNVDILNLPAHNLNPLNYLIRYNFERLIPYFEHCVALKETHQVNVLWLWIASILNKPRAKELLFSMGDASVEGRTSLVKCTQQYYQRDAHDLVDESLIRYFRYEEKELGRAYDMQFEGFAKWPIAQVKPYLDKFFSAPVSKFCSHYVYKYLKQYAQEDAKKVLAWLMMLYPRKRDDEMEQGDIWEVLLAAYNRILVFDKSDECLEKAMDLLDLFLMGNNEFLVNKAVGDLGYE